MNFKRPGTSKVCGVLYIVQVHVLLVYLSNVSKAKTYGFEVGPRRLRPTDQTK